MVGNKVKFDLKYSSYSYIVELNRESEGQLFSGNAVRQGDNHSVMCRALLEFTEGSIEIHGIEWLEDGVNFRWSTYVEEADYA